ncbi:hypothetical protein M413DRAFT_442388 [Hebeloma cylindrosporum]|uniref:DNA polymerase delta subunit 4 n=1 Tax=Hebeloma cylindrosporum TaxID=76867 RepID=A0A0C3CJX3_HEBCY|nr:hypothetical protein M413DRAFT_442388 [Hebeloma cylindrosporum h7]
MSTTLKQGKLGFASAKRTASSTKIGKPNTTTSTTALKPTPKELSSAKTKTLGDLHHEEISSDDDIPGEFDDIEAISTKSDVETTRKEDEEDIEDAPTPPPAERKTRSSTKKTATPSKNTSKAEVRPSTETAKVGVFRVSNARPEDVAKKVEANSRKEDEGVAPELNLKDPKWRKHYGEIKEKMGHMHAIHGEKQNKIHEILRVFDNSYEYGPCVGVSRRDRWDRAQALGLNPPKEVDDILNTKQGLSMPEYSQSVFHGEV